MTTHGLHENVRPRLPDVVIFNTFESLIVPILQPFFLRAFATNHIQRMSSTFCSAVDEFAAQAPHPFFPVARLFFVVTAGWWTSGRPGYFPSVEQAKLWGLTGHEELGCECRRGTHLSNLIAWVRFWGSVWGGMARPKRFEPPPKLLQKSKQE